MEMLLIDLTTTESYQWFDNTKPAEAWVTYKVCNPEAPYRVKVEEHLIFVDTQKPIKKAVHLRGTYGKDKQELDLLNETSFEVQVNNPHPHAETFRIYF